MEMSKNGKERWTPEKREEAGGEYRFISPNGEEVVGKNLRLLAEEFGLSEKRLREVKNGRALSHKGWTLPADDPKKPATREKKEKVVKDEKKSESLKEFYSKKAAGAEVYPTIIISGVRYEGILNLSEFCREHKLNYNTVQVYMRQRKPGLFQRIKFEYPEE